MRRRRRVARRALVVALVVGAWLAACAVLLVRARDEAASGLDSVSAAEKQADPGDLLAGRPKALLDDAERSFRAARDRLKNPLLTPVRWLPVVGRQLRAATAMAAAATDVTDVGSEAVDDAKAALEQPHDTGAQRIALLRRLGQVAARADTRLRKVSLGPSKALVSPLADKRAELEEKLGDLRDALSDGAVVADGLADLLAGPRRYLILAANNAEMRAGSGMFLSAGELSFDNGDMALGQFRSTGDIAIAPDKAPSIDDADLAGRWGFLNPNREWRNLAPSPRFPASAQLAARMWPVAVPGAAPVDGVLALDPVGLRALLKVTGPIDTVSADNVVALLTHDQYAGLPPPSARFDVAQAARREQLGIIAKAVVDRLSHSSVDVTKLGDALAEAVRGRHLLAWSSRPDDGAMWKRGRVDASVERQSLLVSVLNRGGNKLDRFLKVEARMELQPAAKEERAVLTVSLANTTPDGENVYVAGPYPGSGVGAGDYAGILAVNVPGFAGRITVDGFDTFAAAGADGPTQVIAVPVVVARGETKTFTVRFSLPSRGALRVEPSARVPAVQWTVPGQQWGDDRSHVVRWNG